MTDLNLFYKQLFALFNNFSNDCMLDGRFKESEINRCLEITHLATQLIESLNQLEKQYESNDIPSILALTLFQYQFQNQSLDKNHLIKALRVLSHYLVLAEPLENDVNTAPSQTHLELMTQALNKFLELNFKKGKKHPISEDDFIHLLLTEIYPDSSNNDGKFKEKISLFENFNFNQFNILNINKNGNDNTDQFKIINQFIIEFNQEYHDLIAALRFQKERIEIFGKIDINSTFINHDLLRIDRLINQLNIDSVNSLNYMQAKV